MAKRSGSKGTRGERKADRQRAQRARERGLPERREEPLRARAATAEPGSGDDEDRPSDASRPVARAKPAGIPPIAKVVTGALLILVAVYVLSRFRDQPPSETSTTPEPDASAATTPEPAPEPPAPAAPKLPAAPAAPKPAAPLPVDNPY
ncbi:MAG TPA: hypothetical protein VJN18_31440 [Polyangiaceae bacterium]|nr:hypothetical protein [Polyangiaceae bacterium]